MARTDIHLDAMLRHLGAAYYESLHGIIHDVRQVLDEIPVADPKGVTVRHGVVTLTGTMLSEPGDSHDLIPLALHMIWDIDGVVDVVNRIGEAKAAKPVTIA